MTLRFISCNAFENQMIKVIVHAYDLIWWWYEMGCKCNVRLNESCKMGFYKSIYGFGPNINQREKPWVLKHDTWHMTLVLNTIYVTSDHHMQKRMVIHS